MQNGFLLSGSPGWRRTVRPLVDRLPQKRICTAVVWSLISFQHANTFTSHYSHDVLKHQTRPKWRSAKKCFKTPYLQELCAIRPQVRHDLYPYIYAVEEPLKNKQCKPNEIEINCVSYIVNPPIVRRTTMTCTGIIPL